MLRKEINSLKQQLEKTKSKLRPDGQQAEIEALEIQLDTAKKEVEASKKETRDMTSKVAHGSRRKKLQSANTAQDTTKKELEEEKEEKKAKTNLSKTEHRPQQITSPEVQSRAV